MQVLPALECSPQGVQLVLQLLAAQIQTSLLFEAAVHVLPSQLSEAHVAPIELVLLNNAQIQQYFRRGLVPVGAVTSHLSRCLGTFVVEIVRTDRWGRARRSG